MPEDDRFAELLGALVERLGDGEEIDVEAVIREHPEAAGEIRAHLGMIDVVDRALAADAASPDRLPERIGDYQVRALLGRGGMGTVYLAAAEREGPVIASGEQVAVKVIHAHLLERRGFFRRFLREAELGKRVIHENVVRTLDVDAVRSGTETSHFLVMEYVEGRTLRQLLDDLETVPEALLREIARQVASGLSAIHTAGIVHRDLKPENVLITKDHRVRIMDLGVARLVEDSIALTQEGQFAGSLFYAAPEQFGQGDVGPKADLYSLGVLLYELVTGENPFRRDDAAAVLAAHLEHEPRKAEEVNPDVSPFFSEVLSTLLSKEPLSRFESSEAVHEVLEEGERSSWWTERERVVREARPRLPTVPVRRETELYGRDTDLEILRAAWDRVGEGEGNTLLVEGEAGIGKSRLVDAFLKEFEEDGAQVLYGSYPPAGGMGGLSDAILEHLGAENLEESLGPYLTVAPRLLPALAAIVRHEAPPEGCEPIQGDALHAVFVHLMRSLAEETPVLWVVEDLHFAEPDSRKIVLSLARAVEDQAILLLLTTRPGLPEGELAHFSRLENCRRTGLGRLGAREVVLLLRDAFKSEALADKLGARIALKSDGVPFFVFEMIRGLKEGQFIEQLPDGSYIETKAIEEIEIPSAVRDLIEVRLADLSLEERSLLDVGAVQGFEFDPDLVARALELGRVRVLQLLAGIERRSGVVRGFGPAYCFDHHQIQEVVYADLHEGLRSEYHGVLAGAYLKSLEGEPSGADAHFLARHHLSGRRPERSLPWLPTALGHLEQGYRSQAVVDLADRALAVPNLLEGEERVELLLRKHRHLHGLGQRSLEEVVLAEALTLADSSGNKELLARTHTRLAMHAEQIFDLDTAQEHLETAQSLAIGLGSKELEAGVLNNLGNVFHSMGRLEDAGKCIEAALGKYRELGHRLGSAFATGSLACHLQLAGRAGEAKRQFECALDLSREGGFWGQELVSLNGLGRACMDLGQWHEAYEFTSEALVLACETGHRLAESSARGNLGCVLTLMGRYEKALEQHEQRVAISRQLADRRGEGIGLLNIGGSLTALGSLEVARNRLREAVEILAEIGAPRERGYALYNTAELEYACGDMEEAARVGEQALACWREMYFEQGVPDILVILGRLASRMGRPAEARERLTEALESGRKLDLPGGIAAATVALSRLGIVDVVTAVEVTEEYAERLSHGGLMDVRLSLWKATNDRAHLQEAKRLLDYLVEHAPEEYRESMLKNVRLNREIMEAWEEHGEQAVGESDAD